MTHELIKLASQSITEIMKGMLENFQIEGDDKSWKRAMFKQNGDYDCSLVIDVTIEDGDKKVGIKTKFGRI